eukprot:366241-Chlamydomonas_euryale.AAC.10
MFLDSYIGMPRPARPSLTPVSVAGLSMAGLSIAVLWGPGRQGPTPHLLWPVWHMTAIDGIRIHTKSVTGNGSHKKPQHPMSLWISSCCLLKGWWNWVAWSAGHAPHGGIGLDRLCAWF